VQKESLPLVLLGVGTYRRNEPLRRLLESVLVASEMVRGRVRIGAVIVDDNPGGEARTVADAFNVRFEAGVNYFHVGEGNISKVRNQILDAAVQQGDLLVMTDDDCTVPPNWLVDYLDVLEQTGADTVTGPLVNKYPAGSPSWIVDEPFAAMAALDGPKHGEIARAATNNSMMRTDFLRSHPTLRFREALGVVGGEDMVFFGEAHQAGMRIRFVPECAVIGEEPADRATLVYQLRSALWLGNTMAVTNLDLKEATAGRIALRGFRRILRAPLHLLTRVMSRRSPQLRWTAALFLQGLGLVLGASGIRLRHH
jgi:succinoglycan biosynthesis protein ExoM